MMSVLALAFLAVQLLVGYAMFHMAQNGWLRHPAARFFAILGTGSIAAVTNLGPLGLILGAPSIVVSSIIVAIAFRPKEKS